VQEQMGWNDNLEVEGGGGVIKGESERPWCKEGHGGKEHKGESEVKSQNASERPREGTV